MSAPEVAAYLYQSDHSPDMKGVRLHHEPSSLNAHTTAHPLIKQEDYVAQMDKVLQLIEDECRYWHGRDEARRGGFANLRAAVMDIL